MPVSHTLNLRFVYSVDAVNIASTLTIALVHALLPCQRRDSRKICCEFEVNIVCIISQYSLYSLYYNHITILCLCYKTCSGALSIVILLFCLTPS
jgi:hypothetical protein